MNAFNKMFQGGMGVLFMTAISLMFFPPQDNPLGQSIENGRRLYFSFCLQCHQSDGGGIPSVYPPLTNDDRLADKETVIKAVTEGRPGGSTIGGITYAAPMPRVQLRNEQVADVLNYIRNSWGHEAEYISPAEVKTARNSTD